VLFGDDSSDPRGALSSTSLSLSKRARGAFNRREPRLALQFRKKRRRKRKKRCSWPAAFLASDATFSIKRGKNSHFLVALAALSLSLALSLPLAFSFFAFRHSETRKHPSSLSRPTEAF
jgi:hypothetical protein